MNNAKSNNFPATFCGIATIETQGWDRCSLNILIFLLQYEKVRWNETQIWIFFFLIDESSAWLYESWKILVFALGMEWMCLSTTDPLGAIAAMPENEAHKNNKFRILICNGRWIDQKMSRFKLKIKHLKKVIHKLDLIIRVKFISFHSL